MRKKRAKVKILPKKVKMLSKNYESEEEGPKLVRPTPRNLKEIKEISNKPKKNNNIKTQENKTYTSEGSYSNSK